MQFRQDHSQRQSQSQRIAPHLIQANTLLQCSTAELIQMIEQEQRENPALDEGEDDLELDIAPEPAEDKDVDVERQATVDELELARYEFDTVEPGTLPAGDSDFDPLMMARAQTSLAETLLSFLRATSTAPDDIRIAEYLINGLDERGYLQIDEDEACAVLRVPCGAIQSGIARLQACDPPGIGARNLRECLLLQLCALREQSDLERYDAVAEQLVSAHWDALVQRRHARLARRLGVAPARLELAVLFIQRHLTPHPAAQYRQPWEHRPDGQSMTVTPDVVIRRGAIGFEIDVLGFENLGLQINPHYRTLYADIRMGRKDPRAAPLTPDHQKHVVAYVERANLFLKNLQQRRRTIHKIARALVESQQGFLETGQRAFLRPLTRTRLAETVGMHESTISRALLHKYVQLPSQEVVAFDIFFEQAATIKDTVAELVAAENADTPLSDQAIADLLKARGTVVARRTVVKYREELRIPASYLRRRR